jgi:hypothetical protein
MYGALPAWGGVVPEVVVCGALGHQVVDVHVAGLPDTVYPVLRLDQHLDQRNHSNSFTPAIQLIKYSVSTTVNHPLFKEDKAYNKYNLRFNLR